jgi:tRNA dimethylallyltransferase
MNLIAILGQTSSGKSDYGIQLAKDLGSCCIVNCDSRQVYRGLNIGTGKVEGEWQNGVFVHEEIKHYLIDFVDPKREYNLIDYIRDFNTLMYQLESKFETIILVGGTGLYAKAILEEVDYGFVKTEYQEEFDNLKNEYNCLSLIQLQKLLDQNDFNNSDWNNTYRLVSHLVRQKAMENNWLEKINYYHFQSKKALAIEIDQNILKQKIITRLSDRINQGIVEETQKFLYLGQVRIWQLGLEYRLSWLYLYGFMTQEELNFGLIQENWRYARRQLVWLKKQKGIEWVRV